MTFVRRLIVTVIWAMIIGALGMSIVVVADDAQGDESFVEIELSTAQVEVLRSHLPPDMVKALDLTALDDQRSLLKITYNEAAEVDLIISRLDVQAGLSTEDRKQLITVKLTIRDALRKNKLELDIHPRILEQRERAYRDIMEADRGDILVRGVVVDGNGKALSDVRIEVDQSIPSTVPFGNPTHKIVVREVIRSGFEYRIPDAYSVSLSFEADGYYPTNVSVTRGLEQGLRGGQPLTRDIRVVLYPVGELTALTRFNGTLRHQADGSGVVFAMALPEGSAWPRRFSDAEALVHIQKMEQAVKRASNGFSAVVPIAPDGLVEMRLAESSQWLDVLRRMPPRLEVRMHGQDDGFIRFEPPAGEKVIGRDLLIVERMMAEAPEKGYKRSLVLNAEDLAGIVFAYFKIRGHYGKALLRMPEVPEDRKGIKLDVSLWIQPNGSRNVAGK